MLKILGHVVATERQHRKWITAHHTLFTHCSSSGFRAHGRGHVNALSPITRLSHQRHGGRATAAKDEGVNDNTLRVIPFGIQHRVLRGRDGKACIGMCGFNTFLFCLLRSPVSPLPVDAVCRWNLAHAFPPHVAVIGQRHVCEDGVLGQGGHAIKV